MSCRRPRVLPDGENSPPVLGCAGSPARPCDCCGRADVRAERDRGLVCRNRGRRAAALTGDGAADTVRIGAAEPGVPRAH